MLNAQAISSNAASNRASVPAWRTCSIIRAILSEMDSPLYFSSWIKASFLGIDGRFSQMESNGVKSDTNRKPWLSKFCFIAAAFDAPNSVPSMAMVAPCGRVVSSHCSMVGVSGSPSLKSSNPESSSCWAAWRKYRESVHNPAWLVVTTAVPADPSNPEIQVRAAQWLASYSLWCGSVPGMMKAVIPALPISSRRALSRGNVDFLIIWMFRVIVDKYLSTVCKGNDI